MKKCSNCFETKPVTEFYVKHTKLKDGTIRPGHQSRCKACNPEVVAGYHARARQRLHDQISNIEHNLGEQHGQGTSQCTE